MAQFIEPTERWINVPAGVLRSRAIAAGGSMYRFNQTILLGFLLVILMHAPAFGQISLVGEWAGRYHEDQTDRVPGDVQGDFTGVPMNEAARLYAEAYDVRRVTLLEHQ